MLQLEKNYSLIFLCCHGEEKSFSEVVDAIATNLDKSIPTLFV